jgi:hypothetical protein
MSAYHLYIPILNNRGNKNMTIKLNNLRLLGETLDELSNVFAMNTIKVNVISTSEIVITVGEY